MQYLYHGDRTERPDLTKQREIGFHFGSLEQARAHGTVIFKMPMRVTNAISVEDPGEWASLHGLQAILKVVDPSMSIAEITEMWRSWNVKINTKDASARIRELLVSEYGVKVIHYVDQYDAPGTDSYIFLTRVDMERASVDECFPNLVEALDIISSKTGKPTKYVETAVGVRFRISDGALYDLDRNLQNYSSEELATYLLRHSFDPEFRNLV